MKVKNAIIMAAGVGERLRPLTLTTPKPLIKVNGVPMIESVIEAIRKNGIEEIYVVVGYQAEKFQYLSEKYPGLTLIKNPYYLEANNISSMYVARDHLGDSIVLDGDQIIYNPDILNPEFTRSGYNVIWCEGETKEWILDVQNGIINGCSQDGGSLGYQLYSISRWSEEDGRRLASLVAGEFEGGNTGIYWDDVPLFYYPDEFELGIMEMQPGDVIEIDSFRELMEVDASYGEGL